MPDEKLHPAMSEFLDELVGGGADQNLWSDRERELYTKAQRELMVEGVRRFAHQQDLDGWGQVADVANEFAARLERSEGAPE